MATSSDFFTEVGNPGTATTLSAPGHTIAGTTFNVVSTSNWPTNTGAVFAVDTLDINTGLRVPGTYTEWEGVVASSTQITGAVLRFGTDQNYPAGSTTRVYIPVASSRENRLVRGLLSAGLSQTGTLQSSIIYDPSNPTLETQTWIGVSSAVNQLTVTNAATGSGPILSATGDDTNIDLKLTPKGTGTVLINGAGASDSSTVATVETTTSTSFVDLATTTDTVTVIIGNSGKAVVTLTSGLMNNISGSYCIVSFAASGANTIAATSTNALLLLATINNDEKAMSWSKLFKGLTPGSTTFKMKYQVSANIGTFKNRSISVQPLYT